MMRGWAAANNRYTGTLSCHRENRASQWSVVAVKTRDHGVHETVWIQELFIHLVNRHAKLTHLGGL